MHSHYERINTKGRKGLAAIIEIIVRVGDPEKVLLISANIEYMMEENIFVKKPIGQLRGKSYHLLVLTAETDNLKLINVKTEIKRRLGQSADVQITLANMADFNEAVRSGNEYENFIVRNAMLWYDSGMIPFADPFETKTTV